MGFSFSSQHNSKGKGEWWSDFKYFNNDADTKTSFAPEKYPRTISMFSVPGRRDIKYKVRDSLHPKLEELAPDSTCF